MEIKKINTSNAPKAIGPYSQGIDTGSLIFLSGQIPINPETNAVVDGGIEDQAKQVLQNIKAILSEANLTFSNVVKTTVFLKDIKNFPVVNDIYSSYFNEPYPARSCVEVSNLPKDVLVEIEAVALKNI